LGASRLGFSLAPPADADADGDGGGGGGGGGRGVGRGCVVPPPPPLGSATATGITRTHTRAAAAGHRSLARWLAAAAITSPLHGRAADDGSLDFWSQAESTWQLAPEESASACCGAVAVCSLENILLTTSNHHLWICLNPARPRCLIGGENSTRVCYRYVRDDTPCVPTPFPRCAIRSGATTRPRIALEFARFLKQRNGFGTRRARCTYDTSTVKFLVYLQQLKQLPFPILNTKTTVI
jgi:hypothetical protein